MTYNGKGEHNEWHTKAAGPQPRNKGRRAMQEGRCEHHRNIKIGAEHRPTTKQQLQEGKYRSHDARITAAQEHSNR
uniref:Uncharacterized protein n=1 Tax=Arundo donax TaxID=35708 RepID=A0A0A9AC79_ARUDO